VQDLKRNHEYKSIPIACLPNQRLKARTVAAEVRFWSTVMQQATTRGVTPSKPKPDWQAGDNCDRVCLSINENISLSLLEARAKK